ncbi:hypothetical protein FHL15_004877 [Xylaria flabelliformis]|uniref:Uncharacterized protein n=1 Tax=Xylaria flabelliformis TaxID=2512241 RepID=A0A553I1N3_9PEZI|nr:hypothetical protein FHL15_004877 [Xylaria flabelliformis]
MSHLPGDPPGVSPAETMYWLGDVLVNLELVTDSAAITKAITWSIEQGYTNFQIVILSLFKVKFAEVSFVDGDPYVKVSNFQQTLKRSTGVNLDYNPAIT